MHYENLICRKKTNLFKNPWCRVFVAENMYAKKNITYIYRDLIKKFDASRSLIFKIKLHHGSEQYLVFIKKCFIKDLSFMNLINYMTLIFEPRGGTNVFLEKISSTDIKLVLINKV